MIWLHEGKLAMSDALLAVAATTVVVVAVLAIRRDTFWARFKKYSSSVDRASPVWLVWIDDGVTRPQPIQHQPSPNGEGFLFLWRSPCFP
jgi:hypothetical protein